MKTDAVLSLLGFAAKAGKLSFGTHATEFSVSSGKAALVIAAEDISEKSIKELKFKANKENVPVIVTHGIDSETLSHRVGKKCGILAVNDKGFADSILKNFEGGKAL